MLYEVITAFRFSNQKYEAGRATLYELYQAKSNLTQALSERNNFV